MLKKRTETPYLAGMCAGVPLILGIVPIGIAYAIMARQTGFSVVETIFMSMAVFAGASQMMAVGMYGQGAGIASVILATFILNLRHLIMSTCVVNRIKNEPMRRKLLAAFGVTDESFAIFATEKKENCTAWYFLGLFTVTYVSWIGGSAIGAITSDFLPAMIAASLGIALYAMFIGILVPNLKHNLKLGLLVLLAAVCNCVFTQLMDSSWALVLSTLICAAIGVLFVDIEKQEAAGDED